MSVRTGKQWVQVVTCWIDASPSTAVFNAEYVNFSDTPLAVRVRHDIKDRNHGPSDPQDSPSPGA
ncbi:hypothetical protein EMIT0P12_90037 [Pseudomonas sp. IT-P12]